MTILTTFENVRDNLALYLDKVNHEHEIVVIQRYGEEDVALIAAEEIENLMETAYLLRSPANGVWLLTALQHAVNGEGRPMTVAELRQEVSLG